MDTALDIRPDQPDGHIPAPDDGAALRAACGRDCMAAGDIPAVCHRRKTVFKGVVGVAVVVR